MSQSAEGKGREGKGREEERREGMGGNGKERGLSIFCPGAPIS